MADTLDAITSDRPYRVARTFDAAREEIIRCSGTQFDPAVVEVYLKIPNELWLELRSEITGQNRRFSTFDIAHPLGIAQGISAAKRSLSSIRCRESAPSEVAVERPSNSCLHAEARSQIP